MKKFRIRNWFLVDDLYEELACVLLLTNIHRLAPQLEAFPKPTATITDLNLLSTKFQTKRTYIIQLCLGSSSGSNSGQGLWIRIHFLRIRIQLFFSTRIRIYCRCGSSFLKLQCDFKLSFEKSKYKFFPLEPHSECDLDQKGILKKIFLYTKIKKRTPLIKIRY